MLSIIIKFLDGIVCHQVTIVEYECIKTDTTSELQTLSCVPLILKIDTKLAILHACCWIALAVITVCKTNDLRSSTIDEVINAIVTIITSTISHISIVSHLMLKSDTSHKFVVTHIVCHIILNVPYGIVHGVIICEELISKSHIVVDVTRTIENVDEWELSRICSTHLVEF